MAYFVREMNPKSQNGQAGTVAKRKRQIKASMNLLGRNHAKPIQFTCRAK